MKTAHAIAVAVVGAVALGGTGLRAQDEPPAPFAEAAIQAPFNISSPGARSLGLGGAFIGLADDATAAFTNPAGLIILSRQEVSIEGRSFDSRSEFADRGHAFGDPTGLGVDTIAGIERGEGKSDIEALSFISYVYPRKRWAIAVYRHKLANFDTSFDAQGAYFDVPLTFADVNLDDFFLFRLVPTRTAIDLDIFNLGVSAAVRVTEGFSIGVGVSYYDFALDSRVQIYDLSFDPPLGAPGGYFGPADFSAANRLGTAVQSGDDEDLAVNLGLLWKFHPKWSIGAVYRQGPEFEFTERVVFEGVGGGEPPATGRFNIPDVWGLGLAFRPSDVVTITFDYDRIEYSVLAEGFEAGPFGLSPDLFAVDDGEELHLGFEYVFAGLKYPLALRAGIWEDPAHRLRFVGSTDVVGSNDLGQAILNSLDASDRRAADILYFNSTDEVHYSAGFGLVFGERFQLDAAVDLSDLIDTLSLSGVFRF